MRRAFASALAFLTLLVIAAPAHAGGAMLDLGLAERAGGVVLAGDRVAWATVSDDPAGIDVHVAAPDGSGHRVTHVPVPILEASGSQVRVALDASDRRIAVGIHILYCAAPCKYQNYSLPYARTFSGPLGGALETVASCRENTGDPLAYPDVEVDGDAVAYRQACDQGVTVEDFASAPPGRHRYPGSRAIQLAGPYLVTHEGAVRVIREWRTGEERQRSNFGGMIDLQADGGYVFTGIRGNQYPVSLEYVDNRPGREIAPDTSGFPRIAGDRVAIPMRSGGIQVRGLDGSVVADSRHAVTHDFDGRRVVWATQPCAVLRIVTWDLTGEAPRPPSGPCPVAFARSTSLRAQITSRSRSVRLVAECPAQPALGCEGFAALLARDGRPRPRRSDLIDLARGSFRLKAGERRTVALELTPDGVCATRRNALRPVLRMAVVGPEGYALRTKSWRVRLAGIERAIARCA